MIGVLLAGAVALREERGEPAGTKAFDDLGEIGKPSLERAEAVHHLQLDAGTIIVEKLEEVPDADEAIAAVASIQDGGAKRIGELRPQVEDVKFVDARTNDADGAL